MTKKNTGKNKNEWVEVSAGDVHDFESDGDELIGIYTESKTVEITGQGESQMYTIDTDDGIKKFWGSTILDQALARIKEGAMIRIKFLGRGIQKGKKQAPKLFKVYCQSEKDLIPF